MSGIPDIVLPVDAARRHLTPMLASNMGIKCQLGEDLLDAQQLLHSSDAEEQQERGCHSPHQGVNFAGTALERTDQDVGDEAGAEAVGN